MGYYMGDYYAGSRGDPGIGSFFGKLLGGAGSLLGLAGVPGAGVLTKIGGGLSKVGGAVAGSGIIKAGKGIIMKHPVLTAAGAAGGIGAAAGVAAGKISKHGAITVGADGRIRRHRRMNVCNPRALRKAIRRTHGFAKLAMRTIHLVHPKKKVRFGGFRKKKAHK